MERHTSLKPLSIQDYLFSRSGSSESAECVVDTSERAFGPSAALFGFFFSGLHTFIRCHSFIVIGRSIYYEGILLVFNRMDGKKTERTNKSTKER